MSEELQGPLSSSSSSFPSPSLPCAFPSPPVLSSLFGWGWEGRVVGREAGLFVFLLSQEVVQMSQG